MRLQTLKKNSTRTTTNCALLFNPKWKRRIISVELTGTCSESSEGHSVRSFRCRCCYSTDLRRIYVSSLQGSRLKLSQLFSCDCCGEWYKKFRRAYICSFHPTTARSTGDTELHCEINIYISYIFHNRKNKVMVEHLKQRYSIIETWNFLGVSEIFWVFLGMPQQLSILV